MCQVHIAALMAEYLLQRAEHETGCGAFSSVSENVVRDENNLRLDHGASAARGGGGGGHGAGPCYMAARPWFKICMMFDWFGRR